MFLFQKTLLMSKNWIEPSRSAVWISISRAGIELKKKREFFVREDLLIKIWEMVNTNLPYLHWNNELNYLVTGLLDSIGHINGDADLQLSGLDRN